MNYTIRSEEAEKMRKEGAFELFKHNGLYCCVQRMMWGGNLNGYVAVPKDHPFYGKDYSDKVVVGNTDELEFNGNYIGLLCAAVSSDTEAGLVSIDLAINVHGGITYSRDNLLGIDKDLFGELWWFGFDTAHHMDYRPFQNEIDLKFPDYNEEYRDMEYVKAETIKLAEQLAQYGSER